MASGFLASRVKNNFEGRFFNRFFLMTGKKCIVKVLSLLGLVSPPLVFYSVRICDTLSVYLLF